MQLKELILEKLPKVTIIIPCYNREKYIKDTIESVLAQTYPNIEVIVVDDGSTDNSPKVLTSFGNKIRVLEHPGRVNKGQSAAINLGISSTESEYIAILDSDDLFAPGKIERQVEFFQNKLDVGVVYCNGYCINEKGKVLNKIFPENHVEENNPERLLLDCYFNLPSNALIRRDAIEKTGLFDEFMRSAQDHDMAIRLAEVTRLSYIDEPLWYYRRHPSSQSGVHAKRRWQVGFKILEKACKRYPYPKKICRKRKAVLNFRIGQCFLEERKLLNALLHFLKAGILDPMRSFKVIVGIEKISSPHS